MVHPMWEFLRCPSRARRNSIKGGKHTSEQIVRKLRVADRLVGEGKIIGEACKELEVGDHTFCRWRGQYGDMKGDNVKELRKLRDENRRLKRMVAARDIDIEILKEAAPGNA